MAPTPITASIASPTPPSRYGPAGPGAAAAAPPPVPHGAKAKVSRRSANSRPSTSGAGGSKADARREAARRSLAAHGQEFGHGEDGLGFGGNRAMNRSNRTDSTVQAGAGAGAGQDASGPLGLGGDDLFMGGAGPADDYLMPRPGTGKAGMRRSGEHELEHQHAHVTEHDVMRAIDPRNAFRGKENGRGLDMYDQARDQNNSQSSTSGGPNERPNVRPRSAPMQRRPRTGGARPGARVPAGGGNVALPTRSRQSGTGSRQTRQPGEPTPQVDPAVSTRTCPSSLPLQYAPPTSPNSQPRPTHAHAHAHAPSNYQ